MLRKRGLQLTLPDSWCSGSLGVPLLGTRPQCSGLQGEPVFHFGPQILACCHLEAPVHPPQLPFSMYWSFVESPLPVPATDVCPGWLLIPAGPNLQGQPWWPCRSPGLPKATSYPGQCPACPSFPHTLRLCPSPFLPTSPANLILRQLL